MSLVRIGIHIRILVHAGRDGEAGKRLTLAQVPRVRHSLIQSLAFDFHRDINILFRKSHDLIEVKYPEISIAALTRTQKQSLRFKIHRHLKVIFSRTGEEECLSRRMLKKSTRSKLHTRERKVVSVFTVGLDTVASKPDIVPDKPFFFFYSNL